MKVWMLTVDEYGGSVETKLFREDRPPSNQRLKDILWELNKHFLDFTNYKECERAAEAVAREGKYSTGSYGTYLTFKEVDVE